MNENLELLLWLQVKHLWLDFLYQPPYQYKNKGTYGHLGGILHAGQHVLGTLFILYWMRPYSTEFQFSLMFLVGLTEGIIHYHIDWTKMNLNSLMKWGPTTSENFWRLLGFDQFLHQITYIWICWFLWAEG